MRFRCLIMILALALPATAQADWRYTKWGMTPAQVLAAAKGEVAVRPVKSPRQDGPREEIGGTYIAGERSFDVSFKFTNEKLTLVSLQIAKCGSLLTDLKSTYGEPINETGGAFPFWEWDDKPKGNRVTLFEIFDSCLLTYGPLANRSTGL